MTPDAPAPSRTDLLMSGETREILRELETHAGLAGDAIVQGERARAWSEVISVLGLNVALIARVKVRVELGE